MTRPDGRFQHEDETEAIHDQNDTRRQFVTALLRSEFSRLHTLHRRITSIVDARFAQHATDKSRSLVPARAAFLLVMIAYAIYQLVTSGDEIFSGGIWAELALVYYPAHDLPLVQQLLAGDAGYLPLPQRLLGLPLSLLDMSASVYPYFYAVVATLGAGALAATFCLPTFRSLVRSDGLRLVAALVLLGIADVNTRQFTNFVYFATVPLIAVTTLAFVGRQQVPRWAWVLPIFMISKPAIFAALPMMVLVAIIRRGRFRAITVASAVCAAAQMTYVSQQTARLVEPSQGLLKETLRQSPGLVLGFVGRWAASAVAPAQLGSVIAVGTTLFLATAVLLLRFRVAGTALMVVGLVYAALNVMINAPVISTFGPGLAPVTAPVLPFRDRVYIGAILAVVLVVVGAVSAVSELVVGRAPTRRRLRIVSIGSILLFTCWFGTSGFAERASTVAAKPGLPRMGLSQFVRLAHVLDQREERACVPVDGLWMLGRRCTMLVGISNPDPNDIVLQRFQALGRDESIDLMVPEQVATGGLSSFALMVRPTDGAPGPVSARAVLTRADGSTTAWSAEGEVVGSGGLVQLASAGFAPLRDIQHIEVRLDRAVDLAVTTAPWQPAEQVFVMWMGEPSTPAPTR